MCAVGAVFNILMMMTANLVGFVIGTEGIKYLLSRLLSGWEGACIYPQLGFDSFQPSGTIPNRCKVSRLRVRMPFRRRASHV